MRKLIAITLLGLCVAASAQDKKAVESEVSFEAGYTTLNQANGLGYLGNSAFFSASIAAKNEWVTPTVSATYLPQGSESQATSLAGELERLRFIIKEITGKTYWYESPDSSLSNDANKVAIESMLGI